TFTVTGGPLTLAGGLLSGNGTVAANVNNTASILAPGKVGAGVTLYSEPFNYTAASQLQGQGGWTEPGYNDPFGSDYQTPEIINQASSGIPAVIGSTAFLVAKVVFAPGPDLITLYVNPTPGSAEGSLVPVASLSVELFAFSQIAISTGAHAHWSFDEIRIGTT